MSERLTLILAAVTIALSLGLLANMGAINQWERAAGYPFGKMCNSIFTAYVDTCR